MRTNQTRANEVLFGAIALVLAIATAAANPTSAQSADYVVTDAGDAVGATGMTLRKALAATQATKDDDRITFAAGITRIQLAQGPLLIGHYFQPPKTGSLVIDGGEGVTIDAGGQSGVMRIESGTVSLMGLNFTNGVADLGGGLMISDGSNVMVSKCMFYKNVAKFDGGGIYTGGVLVMTDTMVCDNESQDAGGGVYVWAGYGGSLAAADSYFTGNMARSAGGGILSDEADVFLLDSTVSGNTARDGGGIYNYEGRLEISGGEFTYNLASRHGNDVYYTPGSENIGIDGLDVYGEPPKGGGRR